MWYSCRQLNSLKASTLYSDQKCFNPWKNTSPIHDLPKMFKVHEPYSKATFQTWGCTQPRRQKCQGFQTRSGRPLLCFLWEVGKKMFCFTVNAGLDVILFHIDYLVWSPSSLTINTLHVIYGPNFHSQRVFKVLRMSSWSKFKVLVILTYRLHLSFSI